MAMSLLLITTAVHGFILGGTTSYLAPYLQDDLGARITMTGIALGLLFAGGIPGQYLGGRMTDRFGRTLPVLIATVGCTGALAVIPYVRLGMTLQATLFLLGAFMFMLQPPMTAWVSDVAHPEVKGLAFGAFFGATNAAGALAPLLAGLLANGAHLKLLFVVMSAVSLVSLPVVSRLGRSIEAPSRVAVHSG